MNYKQIQNELVKKYRIDLCDGSKCKNDWSRTHSHTRQRRVCKWIQVASIQSTFILLHEIGHIVANRSFMRRCEEEYYASQWALDECAALNIIVPGKLISDYQDYINQEHARGLRRGGRLPDVKSLQLKQWDQMNNQGGNKNG